MDGDFEGLEIVAGFHGQQKAGGSDLDKVQKRNPPQGDAGSDDDQAGIGGHLDDFHQGLGKPALTQRPLRQFHDGLAAISVDELQTFECALGKRQRDGPTGFVKLGWPTAAAFLLHLQGCFQGWSAVVGPSTDEVREGWSE